MENKIWNKILVNVKDLQHGSAVLVKVKCDDCGKEYFTHYSAFYKCNHDGQSFCLQCAKAKEKTGNKKSRNICGYYLFLHNVLKRDLYTCQCCGDKNKLEVHHLDGYNWCTDKRTDVDNGVTLCEYCHKIFHKRYGNKNVTKECYEKWINNIDFNELLQEKNNIIVSNQKHSQIYCLTTNEIFYSFRDAAGAYNIKQMDNIRMCCLKKQNLVARVKTVKN